MPSQQHIIIEPAENGDKNITEITVVPDNKHFDEYVRTEIVEYLLKGIYIYSVVIYI